MRVLVGLLVLMSACHSDWGDGMQAFEDARYPQAAASFRRYEPAARNLSAPDFTEYALYRGLTHLALGDFAAASRWLGAAKQRVDREPQLLGEAERGRLLAAWRSMGHMPGESAAGQ
jgi:hypothetical protein